jgi:hypothetical protein
MQFRAIIIYLFLRTSESTAKHYELFLNLCPNGLHYSFAGTTSILKSGTQVISLVFTVKILCCCFQTLWNRGHTFCGVVLSPTKLFIKLSCPVTAVFTLCFNTVILYLFFILPFSPYSHKYGIRHVSLSLHSMHYIKHSFTIYIEK